MNSMPTAPAEKSANLAILHRELAQLAAHTKPVDRPPRDGVREPHGAVLVIRGK